MAGGNPGNRRESTALTVVSSRMETGLHVAVVGELDLATAPILEYELDSLLSASEALFLDLSAVTFIDCSGLRPLEAALGAARGRVRVLAASRQVRRLLELLDLTNHLQDLVDP